MNLLTNKQRCGSLTLEIDEHWDEKGEKLWRK
ncbi:hypothetical protein ES703_13949 [subsurface metagenome]